MAMPDVMKKLREMAKPLERDDETGLPIADPKKGVDAGDLEGPNVDFFKKRDHSKDSAGLAKALKNRK